MPLRWPWQDIDLRFTLNMGDPVEPREFFEVLRRRWLSIIVTASLLTLASVAAMTLMMPKAYTASTRVFFASGDSLSAMAPASSFVGKQMASYAELATSPRVLDQVVEQLGLNITASSWPTPSKRTSP